MTSKERTLIKLDLAAVCESAILKYARTMRGANLLGAGTDVLRPSGNVVQVISKKRLDTGPAVFEIVITAPWS